MIRPAWTPSGTPTMTGIPEVDVRISTLTRLQHEWPTLDPVDRDHTVTTLISPWVDDRDEYEPVGVQWHYGFIVATDGSAYRRHRAEPTWGCVLEPGDTMIGLGMFARLLDIKPGTLAHTVRVRKPKGNPMPDGDAKPDGLHRLWYRHTVFICVFDRPGPGWRSDHHHYDRST
jgi:hypothetical protein